MRQHVARVLRIPSQASVVTVVQRGRAHRTTQAALDALYAGVLDRPTTESVSPVPGVELLVTGAPAPPPGDLLLWGSAWSTAGPATDDELVEVLHDPTRAQALTGRFLLLGPLGGSLRLVVSADVVHVLHRADHGGATAWSTKALGALAALGRPAELDEGAVAELVLLDFVLGDRTILRGVSVLDEATTTDLDSAASVTSSWWPRDERLAPGPPSSAADLRRLVTAAALPLTGTTGAYLALTAGRDSTLVAGCLTDAGARLPTLTMGDPAWPDAVGAAAIARHLGWHHQVVPPAGTIAPSFDAVRRWSAWTDGQVIGRDLVGAELAWPPGVRSTLSGSGGEIGRAFWRDPDAVAPTGAPGAVRDRIAAELAGFPGDRRRQLDALYAFGRMRKWLGRSRPIAGQDAPTAAFLGPEVVRCLLDLPAGGFDEALALGPDLRGVAAAAVGGAGQARPLLRRLRDRHRPPLLTDVRNLEAMLTAAGETLDPVITAVGATWWRQARTTAATSTRNRLSLWNAVAVAGFVAWADERKNAFQSV